MNTKPIVKMGLSDREVERVNRLDDALNRERLTTVKPVNREQREREWLSVFTKARNKAGISMTAAAVDMGGISIQLLSAQEAGAEGKQLSFRRMCHLGRDFWLEALPLIAEFYGISIGTSPLDEEHRKIGKAYCELQQQVSRTVTR